MAATSNPKTILCNGDSLTWGFNPAGGEEFQRFDRTDRWTRRLEADLGAGYHVIEEGLNVRTTVFDDPVLGGMSGLADLPNTLKRHMPIDLVVIMLGSNDLKRRFCVTAEEIARGLGRLLEHISKSPSGPGGGPPKILVLIPPIIGDVSGTFTEPLFDGKNALAQSLHLRDTYPPVAAQFGAYCFDTAQITESGKIDGLHFDADQLEPIAKGIAPQIRAIFE